MKPRFFAAFALFSALAVACSGVDSDLLGPAMDGGGDDDSGSSSNRRDSGVRDATTSDSGHNDGGVIDSGPDASHPHRDGGIVPCGDVDGGALSCSNDHATCCGLQWEPPGAADIFACTNNSAACAVFDAGATTMNVAVTCRDESYCPGNQVCCGLIVGDGVTTDGYQSVQCVESCPLVDDAGLGTAYRRLCDPAASVDECAEVGEVCADSTILPGFHVCQ